MSNSWSFAWLIEKKTTSIISIVELAFHRLGRRGSKFGTRDSQLGFVRRGRVSCMRHSRCYKKQRQNVKIKREHKGIRYDDLLMLQMVEIFEDVFF